MSTVDVAYIWGLFGQGGTGYTSPQLVPNVGTGGQPTPFGQITMLDSEAQWGAYIIGGIPYGVGQNGYQITQTTTSYYVTPQVMDATTDNGTYSWSSTPGITMPIVQVDGGDEDVWALDSNGAVWSWGGNNNGIQGNNNSTTPPMNPLRLWNVGATASGLGSSVPASNNYLALQNRYGSISLGSSHGIGLQSNGMVIGCGGDQFGQCGDGISLPASASASCPIPIQVLGGAQGGTYLTNIASVSVGNKHSMALDNSGNIWTWGHNAFGQLGNGTYNDSSIPVSVDWSAAGFSFTPPTIVAINGGGGAVATDGQSLALDSNGHLWGWGANTFGQLGLGTSSTPNYNNYNFPQLMDTSLISAGFTFPIIAFSSGRSHGIALDSNNVLWAFGDNSTGALGIPSIANKTSVPTPVTRLPSTGTITKIFAGNDTSMIVMDIPVIVNTGPMATRRSGGMMGIV